MNMSTIIKQARKNKGMTQEQLADLVGVSLQTIRRWEWGSTAPNSKLLSKLAGVLNIPPEQLLENNSSKDTFEALSVIQEQAEKSPFKTAGNVLVYERNGERMELPPTEESYAIFRDIAMRIAGRDTVLA